MCLGGLETLGRTQSEIISSGEKDARVLKPTRHVSELDKYKIDYQ